jgi:hypothetical protein
MPMKPIQYAYVFHKIQPDFSAETPVVMDDFQAIAHVLHSGTPEEAVEVAFRETNSIDSHWYGVFGNYPRAIGTIYVPGRSTATEDLIVVGNQVWRLTMDGWKRHADVQALDLIYRIPIPYHMLHGAMLTLTDKYHHELSFGYIGSLWSNGAVNERDDRCWSVFNNGPLRQEVSRWGRFSTKELPCMAESAKTVIAGKSRLETWVEALSTGDAKSALRLSCAYGS